MDINFEEKLANMEEHVSQVHTFIFGSPIEGWRLQKSSGLEEPVKLMVTSNSPICSKRGSDSSKSRHLLENHQAPNIITTELL